MTKQLLKPILTIILITMIIANLHSATVMASGEQASIDAADLNINQAFENVLAVERAGGNVTHLLARLNEAEDLLAEAKNAYQSGDFSVASSKAESASLIANQVSNETLNMPSVSLGGTQDSLWLTVVFSVTGAVVFTIILFFVWRRFRRAYLKRLLEMKPAAKANAT